MTEEILEFGIFTRIIAGVKAIHQVPALIKSLGGKRILIVTDRGVENAGLLNQVTSLLREDIQFTLFKDVEPDPTVQITEKAAGFCKEQNPEVIVGIGGGSVIDTAKSVALLMTNPGSIINYEGFNRYSKHPLPMIAIPTTAGSGSEVTRGLIISDTQRNFKMTVAGNELAPRYAVLDPYMVASLPPILAATTGMDTLTHAIEAFVSLKASPFTDALAFKAIEMVGRHLRPFAANPSNLQAGMAMQTACTMAGFAFPYARLGNVHAMSHPLGGHYHLPHGLANAILLPYVMRYNYISDLRKFGLIARGLGENTTGLSSREAALRSVHAVRNLLSDLGISPTLKDTPAKEEGIPSMAKDALETGFTATNPRRSTVHDIKELYRQAFAEDLGL